LIHARVCDPPLNTFRKRQVSRPSFSAFPFVPHLTLLNPLINLTLSDIGD